MAKLTAVILAAGKGTRMKSKLPKVLHKVGGHPMLEHVMDAAEAAGCRDNVVVIGHGAELVRELVGNRARIALQAEQLGTGHAVLQAADTLKDFTGTVMILCGDTPLLEAAELQKFYEEHPYIDLFTPDGSFRILPVAGVFQNVEYWDFTFDYESDAAFLHQIDVWKALSTFKSDTEYAAKDRFVVLTLCTYDVENSRFLLVGKLEARK